MRVAGHCASSPDMDRTHARIHHDIGRSGTNVIASHEGGKEGEALESHSRGPGRLRRVTPNAFADSRRNFHHYARERASRQKLLSYTDKAMLDRLVTPTDALAHELMP